MIWIVDGSRLEGNRNKISGWNGLATQIIQGTTATGLHLLEDPEGVLPSDWLDSRVPVCFDYQGPNSEIDRSPDRLFLLYPEVVHDARLVEPLARNGLIRAILSERVSLEAAHKVAQQVRSLRLSRTRR